MKQVFLQKGSVHITEVAPPLLNDHAILVNVHYSFISSGTENATIQASNKSLLEKYTSNITEQTHKVLGTLKEHVSIAPVVIEGDPPRVTGKDIHSPSGTLSIEGGDVNSAKVCGLLMIKGTLYAWVRNINPPGMPKGTGSKLMFSRDHARTWEWVDWNWPTIGYPTWMNAGKNYMDARDGYAYFISPDGPSAYFDYDSMLIYQVILNH